MKRKVSIKLVSKQSDGEQSDKLELETEGMFRFDKHAYEITYDETEVTGYEGDVTKLEVEGSKIVLTRSEPAPSNLIIELGKKHHCHYGTPFGEFMVGVTARDIESNMTEKGGTLGFSYVIDINSGYVGDFEVDIDVKPLN